MMLPIKPFVAAGKLMVLVWDAVTLKFCVELAVGLQQIVFEAAVEA